MQVASFELCKELYKVSGWKNTDYGWIEYQSFAGERVPSPELTKLDKKRWTAGAYDIGYLLDKIGLWYELYGPTSDLACVCQWSDGKHTYRGVATTPQDAAAKLAIELFKQKILTPENE